MASFPHFSNIADYAKTELNTRKDNPFISELNCWVRVVSAVSTPDAGGMDGLVLLSNPNAPLFSAANSKTSAGIYGSVDKSGIVGTSWTGESVATGDDELKGRPSPIVTSFEVDEGAGSINAISRKATFTIRCFTPAQLNTITEYFLEPGFTVFLEWGWNNVKALKGFEPKLDVNKIAQYQSFEKVDDKRKLTNGNSDVFLGFITGGNIKSAGTMWDVDVRCSGFTELPSYFMVADHAQEFKEVNAEKPDTIKVAQYYAPQTINQTKDLGIKRFMMAYNLLPSNKQTKEVADLLNKSKPPIANIVNFINVDDSAGSSVNRIRTEGQYNAQAAAASALVSWVSSPSSAGAKTVGDEKFIRFGALMQILNATIAKGYLVGEKNVVFQIVTENTVISAFPYIFSTDKTKLFIPNPTTPFPAASEAGGPNGDTVTVEKFVDNTVNGTDKTAITFPKDIEISKGVADGKTIVYVDATRGMPGFDKAKGHWGYLDDLYVNMEFIKGILETENLLIKDALYQILNGMSSAAGGMWDFQIEAQPVPKGFTPAGIILEKPLGDGDMILQVVDLNFTNNHTKDEIYTFELQGVNSIFIDASFNMDISGALMSSIVAKRLGAGQNLSNPPHSSGKLFAKGKVDKVLQKIDGIAKAGAKKSNNDEATIPPPKTAADKEKLLKDIADRIAMYPHVEFTNATANAGDDPFVNNYLGAYADLPTFKSFKLSSEEYMSTQSDQVTPLMGITFEFTIHGIAGFKRGDRFCVKGIPKMFEDNGFFQIRSIKHILTGMQWTTVVEGQYRQVFKNDTVKIGGVTEANDFRFYEKQSNEEFTPEKLAEKTSDSFTNPQF